MTDDHLSLDELAELDEGLLPPERISATRAHLHGCADCQAKADAISATSARLGALPPVTMPPEVAARLADAIAAEAAASVPTPRPVEAATARSADVVPKLATVSRPRFGRPSAPAAAAAAVVVLAAVAIVFGNLHHNANSNQDSAGTSHALNTPAGSTISSSQPTNFFEQSTGRTYTAVNLSADVQGLVAQAAPAAGTTPAPTSTGLNYAPTSGSGAGGAGVTSGGGTTAGGTDTKPKAGKNVHSHRETALNGTNRANPPAAGGAVIPAVSPVPAPSTLTDKLSTAPVPAKLQPLYRSRGRILACSQRVTGQPGAVPLVVDFGLWTGGTLHAAPSAIFVFQGNSPDRVSVYITNPRCSGNDIVRDYMSVAVASP